MTRETKSELLQAHLPCDSCGSSDALCLYSDGHTYCFSCQERKYDNEITQENNETNHKGKLIGNLTFSPLKARGITETTCRKYGYGTTNKNGKKYHVATYYDSYGNPVGQKLRDKEKHFSCLGNVGKTFFGQQLFNSGERIYITEGEIDCLTLSQLLGNTKAVVSVPTGAGGAKKVFENNLEWLNSFEEVFVIFDNDKAGREATKAVEGILPTAKLKVVTLTLHKDPNEYYLANHGNELLEAIENAKAVTPENIINGNELWEDLKEEPEEVEGYSLPWDISANEMIRGLRKGEITMVTAGTGIGKSTAIREIMYDLVIRHNKKVGIMMLEENILRTAKGIIGLNLNKPIHISRKGISDEDYKNAFQATLGSGQFILYNHFGSLDNNSILKAIRYMAVSMKCDFIMLDHISIAVSGIESNNERKLIDILMTRLRSLCEELGVGIIAVCHLKRVDNKASAEEGGAISLDDLRGSQAIAQLSDTIIALERNQQAENETEKNLMRVRILKCRQTGNTGLGGKLYFNKLSNRLDTPTEDQQLLIAQSNDTVIEEF